jgi:condensin complex subunit 3
MPARIPTTLESLASAIPKAFEQAQNSSANHQKNFISLHKIHIDAAAKTETIRGGEGIKLVGERAFEDCFIDVVNRVLVKFVAGYIKFLNAKGACSWRTSASFPLICFSASQREVRLEEAVDDDDETTATRFTRRLLKHFLKGFEAKDKNVRYRVVCFVAEVISQLGELEYAIFLFYTIRHDIHPQRGYVQLPTCRAIGACP